MTEEMIEDMEESVMNADQNVALDIHVERSDRTVTVVNIEPITKLKICKLVFLPLVVPNNLNFLFYRIKKWILIRQNLSAVVLFGY